MTDQPTPDYPHWNDNLENRLWATLKLTEGLLGGDVPPLLAHYTSASGAKGILEGSTLYASDPRYLNDVDELRHVQDTLEECWEAYCLTHKGKSDERVPQMLNLIEDVLLPVGVQHTFATGDPVYVASFADATPPTDATKSPGDDRLSQWRGYGGSEGPAYALTFDGPSLAALSARRVDAPDRCSWAEAADSHATIRLLRVIYAQDEQRDILNRVLRDGLDHILNDALRPNSLGAPPTAAELIDDRERNLAVLNGTAALKGILLLCAVSFKNKGFEEEQEWRLVAMDHGRRRSLPQHRVGAAGLIPFRHLIPPPGPTSQNNSGHQDGVQRVTIYPDGEPAHLTYPKRFGISLPLVRITQGPGMSMPELGVEAIRGVLERTQYPRDIEVTTSSTSYRRF